MSVRVAYSTGFWCTNVGNAFFSLGVDYVLKKILGDDNVTVVSDYQTYTSCYGKRLYPDKNQLEYISKLDVDYLVLAGPVLSKYFLTLWKNIIISLESRGVRLILLSAGMMKMTDDALEECKSFFEEHNPYVLCSRDHKTFETFGKYADYSYDGICFAFFTPDYYHPAPINEEYLVINFDKIPEPKIWVDNTIDENSFDFNGKQWHVKQTGFLSKIASKTDRFSDALIYAASILPQKKRDSVIDGYSVFRTDHRFHPHYRRKIYNQENSFCADIPYGYLELYSNSKITFSDRVHACAVTLAYGHSAMLFAKTNRVGLLDRVGAGEITEHPVSIDTSILNYEKQKMLSWLAEYLK